MTIFIRLVDLPLGEKPSALRAMVASLADDEVAAVGNPSIFERDLEVFAQIPGTPMAYWVSDSVRGLFRSLPAFESQGRIAVSGGKTLDDFRWIRARWEVSEHGRRGWVGFAKGGSFSPYYADVYLLLDWRQNARALKEYLVAYRSSRGWSPNWTAELHGSQQYLRPGLTWPRRTEGLSFRALPGGCIFGDKGPAAFVDGDNPESLLALAAIANSRAFAYLLAVQLARTELAQSFEVGLVQQTPVPNLSQDQLRSLAKVARRAWSLKRRLDSGTETSAAFLLPVGLNERVTGLDQHAIREELDRLQSTIDDTVFGLYGFSCDDRAAIEAQVQEENRKAVDETQFFDGEDEAELVEGEPVDGMPAAALLSWLVGVAFGRFDPRLVTGERVPPAEPGPFDPLPLRSPGMWPENEKDSPAPTDILVDDPGHAADIAARVAGVAAEIGLSVPESLRTWLARDFFPFHLKMYSKSRRKAPIYWQLATPSGSYSVWLYTHALTMDTLFRMQNDYVAPKVAHEERKLAMLEHELRERPTTADRKVLLAQEAFVQELRAFLEEVKRVAPLWQPALDDGILINVAPLWRLVTQHKPWQKDVKAAWDALCEGKYDWAKSAMRLWPERVTRKCAADLSFAMSHGLDRAFWKQEVDGKWTAMRLPPGSVDKLALERSSPAVKEALVKLLEATVTAGGSNRRRGGGRRVAAGASKRGTH